MISVFSKALCSMGRIKKQKKPTGIHCKVSALYTVQQCWDLHAISEQIVNDEWQNKSL